MTNHQSSTDALRPVRPEDEEFLCALYGGAREEELAQVPWSAEQREAFIRFQFAAQQRHYQTEYPDAEHQIILVDGQPAGRLYVDRRANEIRIMDIMLLTRMRGQGIGAPLIEELMEEARQSRKRLTIYVESFSRSRGLFERLGFKVVNENGFLLLFEWRPAELRIQTIEDGFVKPDIVVAADRNDQQLEPVERFMSESADLLSQGLIQRAEKDEAE